MRVFFSGIGGVGIGPLALIARDLGHDVIGSDSHASRYTSIMEDAGVEVLIGQTAGNITAPANGQPVDWFVHTAALPADHPELKAAQNLGIRTSKRDEFLSEIIRENNLKLIAASGTHGKTTATGLLIWLFKESGVPASYSIGTNIPFGPSGQYLPESQYFIYEADEYDRNFLSFEPFASVISSVDYDHPDTFPTPQDYLDAFRQFIRQSHCAFMWREDSEKIGGLSAGSVHVYGAEEDLSPIKLAGHNQKNAYLAVQCVHSLIPDKPLAELFAIASRFPGTERRFERLAENLYTDYAHHPVEIASTLGMARQVSPNVVAVYQPHQNLRQHELAKTNAYRSVFKGAKRVYWLPTYLSREPSGLAVLPPEELLKSVAEPEKFEVAALNDELKEKISSHLGQGDLVLLMGAGDIDAWARENF